MPLGLSKGRARVKLWLAVANRHARRVRGDVSGTTAVEFALVAPLVIALILGATQIAAIYLAQAELENAAEQAARLVLTNQAPASGSAGQASFLNTVCGYLPALFACSSVMVDLESQAVCPNSSDALTMTPPTLTYNSSGQVTNTWNYNPGSGGSLEILRVMYQWPVFTGPLGLVFSDLANGTLLLTSTQVFQNEPGSGTTPTCS
jgi:Flp pilus assembly protein TadG